MSCLTHSFTKSGCRLAGIHILHRSGRPNTNRMQRENVGIIDWIRYSNGGLELWEPMSDMQVGGPNASTDKCDRKVATYNRLGVVHLKRCRALDVNPPSASHTSHVFAALGEFEGR